MKRPSLVLAMLAASVTFIAACDDDDPTEPIAIATVAVTPTAQTIFVGGTQQMTATLRDASSNTLTGRTVSWSTSANGIATVSGTGLVTGVAPGIATITATSEGKSANTTVTVAGKTVTFTTTMTGAQEVPANNSTATGTFTGTLDTTTNVFTYSFTFTGLGSNVNNGHIHGPADPGVNAGTTINFNTLPGAVFTGFGTATSGSGSGTTTLNAANQITATINGDSLKKLLFAGKAYVNLHSVNIPGGEIRGQLARNP
jgi:hypothetical protein